MPLKRTSAARLADAVVEQMEALIEVGEWQVGHKLPPEAGLVEQLGVGRSTVREAIRALEHAGMLETRRGDGTFVRSNHGLSAAFMKRTRPDDAGDVLEVRCGIETFAVRLAARRRNQHDVQVIAKALAAYCIAHESNDSEQFLRADVAFHRAVVAAAHNPVLTELWEAMNSVVNASAARVIDELSARPDITFPDHRALATAVIEGDEDQAALAVQSHVAVAGALLNRTTEAEAMSL